MVAIVMTFSGHECTLESTVYSTGEGAIGERENLLWTNKISKVTSPGASDSAISGFFTVAFPAFKLPRESVI